MLFKASLVFSSSLEEEEDEDDLDLRLTWVVVVCTE